MDLFSKRHLLEALKEAKVPYSYKALLKFERDCVIPEPSRVDGRERFYTKEQIESIVQQVMAFKKKSHLPK